MKHVSKFSLGVLISSLSVAMSARGLACKEVPHTPAEALTIFAYGDTRTGPWGQGDNSKQKQHARLVCTMLKQPQLPQAVIFTGDAVMTNFFLWKKAYWRDFRAQANKFVLRNPQIKFFPSLGNHEAETNKPLFIEQFSSQAQFAALGVGEQPIVNEKLSKDEQIGETYESAEDAYGRLLMRSPSLTTSTSAIESRAKHSQNLNAGVDLSKPEEQKNLQKLLYTLDLGESGNLDDQLRAANTLGEVEAAVQQEYYEELRKEGGCGKDYGLLREAYLDQPQYSYLKQFAQGHSFYAVPLEYKRLKAKIIALDTNCLSAPEQQRFFKDEVDSYKGTIIVFGHHPPVDESKPAFYWDAPLGWEFYKPYFTSEAGVNIRLWIFGHVHNYQRRNIQTDPMSKNIPSPVMLISGGGGASKRRCPNDNQWQPKGWPNDVDRLCVNGTPHTFSCKAGIPCLIPTLQFVKIAVREDVIDVDVIGEKETTKEFSTIDTFSIKLK